MKTNRGILLFAIAVAAVLAFSAPASADFGGQVILGPLMPGSAVNGNTTGATDDNDGWDSGIHIFDLWPGPDDVWQLDWPGGDLDLEMIYEPDFFFFDLDLFLYSPGSYDSTGIYSIINTGIENISVPGAAAGTYYVVVDGVDSFETGPYSLTVSPEPTALALMGIAAAIVAGRSRRRR